MSTKIHDHYGVAFTQEQWDAVLTNPPVWEANPPQREEFGDDHSYAVEVLEYAKRAIPSLKKRNLSIPIP